MGKNQNNKLRKWWSWLRVYSGLFESSENSYFGWQRKITSFLLAFILTNISGPSAIALFETKTALALDLGGSLGSVGSAINSLWTKTGLQLPKYDDKNTVLVNKALTGNEKIFDLVAILVDEDIANNTASYDGLISTNNPTVPAAHPEWKLSGNTLMDRIERYAKDIQNINKTLNPQPYQKTVIIKVKKNDPTSEIAAALERLYLEGDGTKLEKNRLTGIVLIGDVPLPVVNKNGNKFVSIFPYTDFDDPYYIFDPKSGDFVVNPSVQKVQAEVWHGVIKPPAEGEDGNKLLAEYFDKNHLYKVGDPEYHDFAKKIFYGDLQKEFKLMGADGLGKYFNYLKYWDDISYFRYNKNWLKKLYGDSDMGKPEGDGIDNDGDGKIDEDPVNGYDDDGDGEDGSPLFGLINGKDDDGDGVVDNDEEGVWGYCGPLPAKGPTKLQYCGIPGKPYKTGNHYNTVPGAKYKVADGINNNPDTNNLIDEGIDEDDGDPLKGIDNDRDGRIDEDTSADNDADHDGRIDEDGPGDANGDGCPGECGVDENNDSVDSDGDGWPDGYERDYGSISVDISGLKKLLQITLDAPNHPDPKQYIKDSLKALSSPTDPKDPFDFPTINLSLPIGSIGIPRIFPFPNAKDWVDNSVAADDDEDGKVDEDGTADNDNDQDGQVDEDPGDALGADSKGDGSGLFDKIPDIRTKDEIESFMAKYNELFDKFYAEANVWIDSTGRYSHLYHDGVKTLSDMTTFPFLIAAKDEFSRLYLKAVNDAVEARIDNYVQKLEYDINLVKGATVSGYVVLPLGNGVDNQHIAINPVEFINFGYRNDTFYAGLEAILDSIKIFVGTDAALQKLKDDWLKTVIMPLNAATPILINGKSIDSITNIQDCSLYRGSNGAGEQSQMVIGNSVYDPNSNMNPSPAPQMPKEWQNYDQDSLIGTDPDYQGLFWHWSHGPENFLDEGIFAIFPTIAHKETMYKWLNDQRLLNKSFAGCFAENAERPERCFVGLATRYIFSLGGTKPAKTVPESAVSHQACFDFKEKSGYDAFALRAYEYLKGIGEKPSQKEKDALESKRPDQSEAYRAPKDIKLFDIANNPPSQFEVTPGSYLPIPPATLLALKTGALMNFSVNFEDVLKKYFQGNRVDDNANGIIDEAGEDKPDFFMIDPATHQPNWLLVGDTLFSRARVDEAAAQNKDKPLKFGNLVIPGTQELYLRISPVPGPTVSSLVFHKEPTIDTIEAQTYDLARDANGNFIEDTTLTEDQKSTLGKYKTNGKTDPDGVFHKKETRSTLSMPIDSPRYVSFRDANGDYQKIVYPDVFQAKDLNEYKQQLADLEAKLASITVNPLYAAQGPASVNGYLTSILDNPYDYDVPVTYHVLGKDVKSVSPVSANKLTDALNWKNLDIDQKHEYALKEYWGSTMNPFTPNSDSVKGYEMLYLNSAGNATALSMKFNKDIPPAKKEPKVESIDCSKPENKTAKSCQEDETPSGGGPGPSGGGGESTSSDDGVPDMTPVFILEWFAALKKWADETSDIISGKAQSQQSCPAGGFADIPDDPGYPQDTKTPPPLYAPVDKNGDGISDATEKTVKLNLKLRSSEKNVLRSGTADQAILDVEALDKDGNLNKDDNYNQIKIEIQTISGNEPVIQLLSPDTAQLSAGKAKFLVQAGDNAGSVSVKVISETLKGVESNKVVISTTKENIKLISYRRYTNYSFVEGPAAGYTIFDGNGKPIAEVDPKTGYITVTDDKYEVRAFAAEGVRPTHLAVVEKASSKKMAVLYFVMDQTKAINFDDASTDYMKKYSELSGIRLKDLNASDKYSLQTINEAALKGDVAIVDPDYKFNNGRIGLIDKRGNIYLYDKLKIAQKPGLNSGSPVVYVIQDEGGKDLMEMFPAAKFEVITQLPWDKLQDLFEKVIASKPLSMVKKQLAIEWQSQTGLRLGLLKIAHAANNVPDSDKDGLNDLEEILIGTNPQKADTNGDGINDLESINQGLDPVKKGASLFQDLKPSDTGFSDIVKLYRRGLFVADINGKIRPNDPITREEFIKLDLGGICVICDNFKDSVQKSVWSIYSFNPFPDKNISSQYKYCVAEGKNRGIISGYKAYKNVGYYVPEGLMTRAEATKVVLETSRQQLASFPEFADYDMTGKPWYYNYVITAQREGIYPKAEQKAIDSLSPAEFKNYFDAELNNPNSKFVEWLGQPISRMEFAMMISRFVDKYDCMQNDQDGDGLPDNLEKYIYASSPIDADTDHGGVKDGAEIFRGSDPNNPADDFPKPDPNADPDGDGLTTGQEDKIGTDPFDPDTDHGGVTDGNEVLLKTDPLDPKDDKNFGSGSGLEGDAGNGKDGAFVSGIEVNPKKVYSVPDSSKATEDQINIEETDRVPADGETEIYVKASIYGDDGNIEANDNKSVIRFGFKNPDDNKYATLDPINVQVKNGEAETKLTSKTKTGLPVVIAAIDGKNVPSDEKEIEVYALDPAKLDIKPVSPVIPSGGLSNTDLKLVMVDKNNNLTNDGTHTITLNTTTDLAGTPNPGDSSILDPKQDEDPKTPGIQISSVTGEYTAKLTSGKLPENVVINASYAPEAGAVSDTAAGGASDSSSAIAKPEKEIFKPAEVSASGSVQTRDDLAIQIKSSKTELKANGKEYTEVTARVVDKNGQKINGYVGEVTAKLLNKDMGNLVDDKGQTTDTLTIQFTDSEAKFLLQSTHKAGEINAVFTVGGIKPEYLKVESYAYKAMQIVLDSNDLEVEADPSKIYTINAKLYDNYGNLVVRDNSTVLNFSIDPETSKFASLVTSKSVKVVNGEASVSFSPGNLTGPVRIRAKATDLVDGYLEVYLNKYFHGKEFRDIKPKILFASLLGSNFGELTQQDYLGGWFVFSGKAESAVSLVTDPKPKVRLVEALPTGRLKLNQSANLETRVEAANSDSIPPNVQIVSDLDHKKDILESFVILKPQTQIKLMSSASEAIHDKETVNVINTVSDNENYLFDVDTDQVKIIKNGVQIASILRNGNINLLSPTLGLTNLEQEGNEINWDILDSGNEIAQVIIATGDLGDVKLLDPSFTFDKADAAPGVYLKLLANLPDRQLVQSYSGNSTAAPKGYYYTDLTQELDKNQAPGFSYLSLESADKADGIGFSGDNKHMLLLAAGSSVGEANLPYASDAGIVLGDPTIRLDNKKNPDTGDQLYSTTGYTLDIGRQIFADSKNIKDVSLFDYDNDGDKDLFIFYENGDVRLIENQNHGKDFVDKGIFLKFPNGVLSATAMDINDDGWDDLVVASADSCKVGEVCVDAYLNDHTNFVRTNLKLEGFSAKNKIFMLRSADMNKDGYDDLITSDDSGNIKVFYTKAGVVDLKGSLVGNLGVNLNQNDNLKAEAYIYYPGMAGNLSGSSDDKYFEKVSVNGDQLEFKSLAQDAVLGVSSTKKANDKTSTTLQLDDEIEYTVKLVNTTTKKLEVKLADIVPSSIDVEKSSVKCLDCQADYKVLDSGQSLRPYVVDGIDLPALGKSKSGKIVPGTRTISYTGKVTKLPKVKFVVGNNLSKNYPVHDNYPDIMATPEGNTSGRVVYYYSISSKPGPTADSPARMTYGKYVTPDPKATASKDYKPVKDPKTGKVSGVDLSMFDKKGDDGIPEAVKYFMDYGTFPGMSSGSSGGGAGDSISELPGIGGAYDDLSNGLDKAADGLENAIGALTCSGGCIPMPINYSFLTPGAINVLGIPTGYDTGLPIFAWGVPSLIPIWPPSPYQASMGGRIYVSPTLTGKIAISTCLGPYLIGFGPVPGNCWTVVVPISPLDGLCSMISDAIDKASSDASSITSDGNGGLGLSNDGSGLSNTPTADGKNYTGGFNASSSLGNYGIKASVGTNVRIPGFPSMITDWFDRQISEIINKLTDLPDIYIILPDVMKLVNDSIEPFKKATEDTGAQTSNKPLAQPINNKGLRGVLNTLNMLPLISIVPQEVIIKIPSLSPAEIDRFINDAKQWVKDEKAELNRVLSLWKCGPFKEMVKDPNTGQQVPGYIDENNNVVLGDRPYSKLCDIITADFTKTIQSVEKNIEVLDSYKQIPRKILAWRNMLTKYVVQVICYIDAIVGFFIGNISKWLNQANAWVDAVAKVIEVIATWKLLLSLIIDYQTDCDKCTSARFSLLELVLKLFMFIPSPPIVPFPKLPDIYLDLSQVQMGIKILWPDIRFTPERIILPKLPRIYLPDLPTVKIEFPAIPVLPDLLVNLPDLPDLPPLSLPVLPNLPPPPKIPEIPGAIKATISILKKIFKILCLIKKGFIPTSETVLKSTVEHMTERGLNPLINLDLGLALQWPEISYKFPRRVVLKTIINLKFDFSVIYNLVQMVADKWNAVVTNLTNAANAGIQAAQNAAQNGANAANNAMQNGANAAQNAINDQTNALSQEMNQSSQNAQNNLNQGVNSFNQSVGAPVLKPNKSSYVPGEINLAALAGKQDINSEIDKQFFMISPELGEYVSAFRGMSGELANQAKIYQKLIDTDFQDIHLVAKQDVIREGDPRLNKSIEDLKKFDLGTKLAALGSEGFTETRKLAQLRQNLLAYVEDFDQMNKEKLDVNNLEDFATVLAKAPTMSQILAQSGYTGGTMLAQKPGRLYAMSPSVSDVMKNSGIDPSQLNQQITKGMFIYNENTKQNEKLINYEDELTSSTTMNFRDMDGDGDPDLIYSFGGNVYLKENYLKNGNKGTFYGGMPEFKDLIDFVPAARSVTGFTAEFNGNKAVDLKWNPSVGSSGKADDLTGYEIIYGKNLRNATDSLNAVGLSKKVFLNSAEKLGQPLTNSLLQPGDNNFDFPVSKLYSLVAVDVQGEVRFDGPEQKVYGVSNDHIPIASGQQIFSTQDTVLKVFVDGTEKAQKKMMENELISMPPAISGKLELQVTSGSITIIDPQKIVKNQQLQTGYKIDLDVVYRSVNGGSAQVILPNNAYTRVDAGQDLEVKVLEKPDQPAASLQLENGFYYAAIRSFDITGFRSDRSTIQLMGPNICSDRQQPLPVAGPAERQVAIFKALQIDASKSFDPLGKVVSYYIDTDLDYDSNGDGDPTNDKNLGHHLDDGSPADTLNDPVFYVGPYKDLNDRKVMLNVVDESGNVGQQQINIKVFVPKIALDENSANLKMKSTGEGGTISGVLDQKISDMPVSLLRDRNGVIEPVKTPSANPNGKYFTDAGGKFSVTDLKLKDSVVIKNEKGEVVAEIDPKTGRVILKNPLYSIEALPAIEPMLPTRVVVKDPSGKVIATVFVVSDSNTDVTIDTADFPYNAGTVAIFKGVHIKNLISGPLAGGLEMKNVPGNAKKYPGAVEILDKGSQERMALLDTGGNFYIYDPHVDLELQSATNLDDPMIFEVIWQADDGTRTKIAEFHISFSTQKPIQILDANKFQLYAQDPQKIFKNKALQRNRLGTNPTLAGLNSSILQMSGSPFVDVDTKNPYFKSIMNLLARGILAGIPAGNSLRFGFADPLQRAEFAKMMLDIFCIVPRPEAYTAPAVFTDMPFVKGQVPWYFAPVKEAYFQGFVTGYLGKIDVRSGRTPFVPEATISKAEAVKVILEALEKKSVISLKNLPVTEPYYQIYLQVAQNLAPYVLPGQKLKGNYILTADEAKDPEEPIQRGDFVKLADRVLNFFDCTSIDTDGDGMPDFWENLHGLKYLDPSDANEDPDGDGLVNLQEYKHGTDPQDADTDKGGVKDGDEVLVRFTDPLNPEDDVIDPNAPKLTDPRQDLAPGVYVVAEPCSTCPCPSAIDHTADFIPGDKLLGVISSDSNDQIFSQSNLVEIATVEEEKE